MAEDPKNDPGNFWHAASFVLLTILIFVIGVVFILISSDENSHYAKLFGEIGHALIIAATIGILIEIFFQWFKRKEFFKIFQDFQRRSIPSIIDVAYNWVSSNGKSIPLEKESIFRLLGIGYYQWFGNEDFSIAGTSSKLVADLYQKYQLAEFKEPIALNYSLILRNNGKSTQADNLISVSILQEFTAINTALNSKDTRYINGNGVIFSSHIDIFANYPSSEQDKINYVKQLPINLEIRDHNKSKIPFNIEYLRLEYKESLSTIKEKKFNQISEIISSKLTVKNPMSTVFILYDFFGDSPEENRRMIYTVFCPYEILPQKNVHVRIERTHDYAENDYHYKYTEFLTNGFSAQLKGFDDGFDPKIAKFFLDHPPTITQTKTSISTPSLLLPRSAIILSWQKKLNSNLHLNLSHADDSETVSDQAKNS